MTLEELKIKSLRPTRGIANKGFSGTRSSRWRGFLIRALKTNS